MRVLTRRVLPEVPESVSSKTRCRRVVKKKSRETGRLKVSCNDIYIIERENSNLSVQLLTPRGSRSVRVNRLFKGNIS